MEAQLFALQKLAAVAILSDKSKYESRKRATLCKLLAIDAARLGEILNVIGAVESPTNAEYVSLPVAE